MKKILVLTTAVIGLAAVTSFAQMSGGTEGQQSQQPGGMMGSPQSQQMIGSQTMRHDIICDMARMMKQMNVMMQKMTRDVDHQTVTDRMKMQDMSKMMQEMAVQMNEMATHIEQGSKMHEKMQSMNKELDAMQREGK